MKQGIMTYKTRLNKMIVRSGRSRVWLSIQLKMDRVTFWRKANSDSFTYEEKQTLNNLLT